MSITTEVAGFIKFPLSFKRIVNKNRSSFIRMIQITQADTFAAYINFSGYTNRRPVHVLIQYKYLSIAHWFADRNFIDVLIYVIISNANRCFSWTINVCDFYFREIPSKPINKRGYYSFSAKT